MSTRRCLLLAGLPVLLAGLLLSPLKFPASPVAGQSPTAPENSPLIIKGESSLVLVDVIATDKKGNYISNLEQKDFHVYEDDAEQSITSFSRESDAGVAAAHQRYVVLLFDDSTMSPDLQVQARAAAGKFVESTASPNRQMAVLDFNGTLRIAQNFTADGDLLKDAVGNVKVATLNPSATALNAGLALGRAQSDFAARSILLSIRDVAKILRTVPGRKTLILFSAGFAFTSQTQSELNATIDALNKANVAVYPVDVRGLATGHTGGTPNSEMDLPESPFPHVPGLLAALQDASEGPVFNPIGHTVPRSPLHPGPSRVPGLHSIPSIPPSVSTNQQVLYALARGTGGFEIFNTNDFLNGLDKVAKEMNQYYNLGYSPPNQAHDGSYHRINVKVVRGGITLRYRTGYYDIKNPDLLQGKPEGSALEAHVAEKQQGDIPVAASTPYFYTEPGVARVNLALSVPATAIDFAREKDNFHSAVDVLGSAYREDGSVAARFSDTVKLDYDKKQMKDFSAFNYQNNFNIAPGTYTLKLALSAGGAKFGKYEVPLVVAPFTGNDLSLGGPALGESYVPISESAVNTDEDLLEGRTPLVFKGMELVPSATNRFAKGTQPVVYLEVYDPALKSAKPPRVRLMFRVVDRKTNQPAFTSGIFLVNQFSLPGNPLVPVGFKLPIQSVPAGEYRLEIKGGDDAGSKTGEGSADFSIQ